MQTETMFVVFDFQKLEVYRKSRDFHISCKSILKNTSVEKYVTDQLGQASYSVVLNIAEGSAKQTKPDRRHFFTISRGSVFECVAILDILRKEEKINDHQCSSSLKLANEIFCLLCSLSSCAQSDSELMDIDCKEITIDTAQKCFWMCILADS